MRELRLSPALRPFIGNLAGGIGTIPMTIFMLIAHRLLPKWQKYALPPEKITKDLAHRAHIVQNMSKAQIQAASLVSHFGYGATMGALYTSLMKAVLLPPALKGSIFGVVIWAGSYLGWLPATGFSTSAAREPIQRNALMIVAHVIWGAVTGITADRLEQRF